VEEAAASGERKFLVKHLDPWEKARWTPTDAGEVLDPGTLEGQVMRTTRELSDERLQGWLTSGELGLLNSGSPFFRQALDSNLYGKKKFRVTLLGLGDVGGTLATGLRLLGGDVIEELRLYDRDENRMLRWKQELGQILDVHAPVHPAIGTASEENLFDTDVFIFTASKHVPAIGEEGTDVRMVQYEANREIVLHYAHLASDQRFAGYFFVVSDPVDLLSQEVAKAMILPPEQIKGFGLGVMFARAHYMAKERGVDFLSKGRVYGPHGKGLIVTTDPEEENTEIDLPLNEAVVTANLAVRATGFKPFIAPAYSSGALSILNALRGHWHDSTVMIDGVAVGIRNRIGAGGVEIEKKALHPSLLGRIVKTAEELGSYGS
jgi:hypothetical protein